MRTIAYASQLACLSACVAACGNDNGGPRITPDSGVVGCAIESNYTSIHSGLFSTTRCALPSCHVTATNPPERGNLDFSAGKAAVYDALLNAGTYNVDARGTFADRVVASSTTTSFLYEKISKDNPLGGGQGRMPPGLALVDCEIEAIRMWIAAGAAND